MWVDSHCHPNFQQFSNDRDIILQNTKQDGVSWLVAVATEIENVPEVQALAETYDNIYFSVGIHPNHTQQTETDSHTLAALAAHTRCVAIGESGLDYFRQTVATELQQQRFRTHIQAAIKVGKPLIVHNRDADNDCLRILKEEGINNCGGIMHCFSSNQAAADIALELGMYISFSGNVTFKRNDALRAVAANIPINRLLIETDSPYLTPVPKRGQRNEPAFVAHVGACLAKVRGVDILTLAQQTTANAHCCFGISLP
ncbi:MAG: TatD family hydrolase [Mariprofundales bacterium]